MWMSLQYKLKRFIADIDMIWSAIRHRIIHLFNPHCPECEDERIEAKLCQMCEYLKMENARLNNLNVTLIEKLTTKIEEPEDKEDYSDLKPLRPIHVPWHVKRAELEMNDRKAAQAMRNAAVKDTNPKSDITKIEELEEKVLGDSKITELDLSNGTSN